MKIVKMSLINRNGKIVNEWSVPYTRRHDAIDAAMDRAEEEGHAGVLWSVINKGKTSEFAFDSHDPISIALFALQIRPFITKQGVFDIKRFMGQGKNGRGTNAGSRHNGARHHAIRS